MKAGFTQTQLAERMGTSQSAVARAESGLVQPSLDFIERFVVETREPVQLGSLILWPTDRFKLREDERSDRVRRAIRDYEFNPWLREPTRSERRSLEADGLSREYFERETTSRPSRG